MIGEAKFSKIAISVIFIFLMRIKNVNLLSSIQEEKYRFLTEYSIFLETSSAFLKSKKFDYQQFDRYLNIQFFHETFRWFRPTKFSKLGRSGKLFFFWSYCLHFQTRKQITNS